MEAKKEFIANRATHLIRNHSTISGQVLVDELNANGHLTSYNTSFKHGRGVYRLIDVTYDDLVTEGRQSEADNVANAFVNSYGYPAWRDKR